MFQLYVYKCVYVEVGVIFYFMSNYNEYVSHFTSHMHTFLSYHTNNRSLLEMEYTKRTTDKQTSNNVEGTTVKTRDMCWIDCPAIG